MAGRTYIIGSFNLRDFNFSNKTNEGEDIKRDFGKIAEIIAMENFDVIALQEVNSREAVGYLVSELNKKYKSSDKEYDFKVGEDMPRPSGSKDIEQLGFIWNTKRLRLSKVKNNYNPRYYQSNVTSKMLRAPYYGRFTGRGMLGGSNFELRLINVHLFFGSTRAEDMKKRKDEFIAMVNDIMPRIIDHQDITEDGEFLQPYTFLMGDYNLEIQHIYKIETVLKFRGKRREINTVQEEKSSLKTAVDQSFIEECYSSNYDHFTYENELDSKLILIPQRIEALSKYFQDKITPVDKLSSYREKVSDHAPVKLTVDFNKR